MTGKIKYDKIPEMLANGLGTAEIAEHFGTTPGSLAVQCSKRKVSLCGPNGRKRRRSRAVKRSYLDHPLALSEDTHIKLQEKARELKTYPSILARNLIEVIVKDDLFAAVLDEQAA